MWDERVSGQGVLEGFDDLCFVFPGRGDVCANGTEGLGTGVGTESAGDFLFELDHAHIAFCLVVVKGDAKVIHKSQDLSFVVLKPIE